MSTRRSVTAILGMLAVALLPIRAAAQVERLVVLTDTGTIRGGLPVLARDGEGSETVRALSRGFGGRWLHVYQLEQAYLASRGGPRPEPAYLALTGHQGGFPRRGFFLGDEEKRQADYVDLFARHADVGRFGAHDQIFPHELAHIILGRVAGPPAGGGANQVHAVGVRTDPVTAFHEGFAEHVQVMAIDDPDADPSTRALATDRDLSERATNAAKSYRRELEARLAPFGRLRMTFPFWFSGTEQVWRYHAVKANLFARQPPIPARLMSPGDPYAAYLIENVLPGEPDGPPKAAARLLATEGVVSALFCRWATDAALRGAFRDDAFYEMFGTTRADVQPAENVYLKMIHAFALGMPRDTRAAVACYKRAFPEDGDALDRVVHEVLLGQALSTSPEIWLANRGFRTGTTLFDQWRGLPRTHTFDLNAASLVDVLGVPGVQSATARAIVAGAPYRELGDLRLVAGMTPGLFRAFEGMAGEMRALTERGSDAEGGLSIRSILMASVRRALMAAAVAVAIGAWLTWVVGRSRWFRALLNATGASAIVLPAVWVLGVSPGIALVAPVVVFGVAGAFWRWRKQGTIAAVRVLTAWVAAGLPASLLGTPLF